jgi:hypothetical protein
MNYHTVKAYLKIAQWAIQSNKSFEDLFLLGDTIESIIHNIDNIANNDDIIINHLLNNNTTKNDTSNTKNNYNKLQPELQTHQSVLLNMQIYDTSLNDAIVYETLCHSCGKKTQPGKRYCNTACFKYVEDFNYKCFWADKCKMCIVRHQYSIITRDFTFIDKHYYIDDNNNVYNDDDIKIAVERDGNVVFL